MIEEFEADIEARGDDLWVLPRGDLDVGGAPDLKEALDLALASDAASIVVDLRGIEFLDSTGLQVLVRAHSSEGGDRISFVPGNDTVQGAFRLSGLLESLPFRPPA